MNYFIQQSLANAAQAPATGNTSRGPVLNGVQFPEQNNYFLSGGVQQNVPGQTYSPQDLAGQSQQKYQQALQQWQQTPGNVAANPIIWRGSSESTPTQHRVYATNRPDIKGSIPIEEVSKYGYASMDMNGYSIPIQEYLGTTYIPDAQLANLQTTYNIQPKPTQTGPTTQELQAEADRWRQAGGTPQQIQDWLKTQGAGAAGVNIQPMTGGGYGLGGGGTQGQNALPFWGLAQDQEGSAVYLGGGGSATPENYLGDWVPEPRRKILSQIGFGNGAGSELLSLRKQYNAEKNNYAKQAIMSKIVNAEFRFNRELQGKEYEYRSLARDANYAAARKMLNEEKAAGRGEGSGAMAANAILSNNHISHGIINHGRIVAPAGNAVEDALEAYQMTGRTPDLSLLQMLAVSDALSQDDYMPGAKPSLMSGYNSMGLGGGTYTGNADAFAYGGDGRQYAKQESWDIIRDYNWANDAQKAYDASMANRNPLGSYQGPTTSVSGKIVQNYGGMPASVPASTPGGGMLQPAQMTRDQIIDEIYQNSGSIGDIPTSFSTFDKSTLESILRVVRGNGTAADQSRVNMPGLQPQEDWYTPPGYPSDAPYTGLQSPPLKPGQYESWVPPANMDPDKMYGPPKTSMTLPLLETLFGIADAPEIKTSSKPLSGTLSPGYTGYDSFDGPLFSNDSRFNTAQPYANAFAKEYGLRAGTPSNQFDRYAVDPFTAGQNAALLQPLNAMQLIRMWSNVNY